MNQKGVAHLLLLVAAVGIIAVLLFTSFVPFKDQLLGSLFPKQSSEASFTNEWVMSGANPERTSWVATEIQGDLKVDWYRPLEPFIPQNAQIIAANNTLFISTARGLYALNAADGAFKWVFPTEMPLGNSPTYDNGVLYVGGFDKKIYAIDATNGNKLWSYDGAEAGYDTNPLVVNNIVYLGNRDGYMYAVYGNSHASKGQLAWKFKTDGPIHLSAAKKDNYIIFASNDSYAYALNLTSGVQVWKTKLPTGNGFYSYWPVVFGNTVIFQGIKGYRSGVGPFAATGNEFTFDYEINNSVDGSLLFPKMADGTLDLTSVSTFFNQKPWRRTYYILDVATGVEKKFDINGDGQANEYAPLLQSNKTTSGATHPPVVGADGKLYLASRYISGGTNGGIGRGQITGWQLGSKFISIPNKSNASDEPLAYSMGGNVIYWNLCCDREIGSRVVNGWEWGWVGYNLDTLAPGFDIKYSGRDAYYDKINKAYGGPAGVNNINSIYGAHGNQNAPIPYNGKIYLHRSNAIMAFSPAGGSRSLPLIDKTSVPAISPAVDVNILKQKLSDQISKIIVAGHLRPGIGFEGYFSRVGQGEAGDNLTDYFHNPADTFLTLSLAYPHVSATQQGQIKSYLASEYTNFNPLDYVHIGFASGAQREAFDWVPEMENGRAGFGPSMWASLGYEGWTGPDWRWTPHTFYALWKYAQITDNPRTSAQQFLQKNTQVGNRLTAPPSDAILAKHPAAHNAWIAGYRGYMELEVLAGNISTITQSSKYATYNTLLQKRASNFNKDGYWGANNTISSGGNITQNIDYAQGLAVARNFMYMTKELGQYLHDNALNKVQTAFNEYQETAPFWMATNYDSAFMEIAVQPLYTYEGMFAAKALILQASREDLARFLDVPAFTRGDLFYMNNLVYAIEANSSGGVPPSPIPSPSPLPSIVPSSPAPSPQVPSPSPAASATSGNLTVQINSSSDDVNEDGTNFSINGSTIFLGNGGSASESYTGFRFNGINIPKGATINSAKIEVKSLQDSWIGLAFDTWGENIGNSPTFTSTNKPSQRSLTTTKVSHNSDVQWLANQSYELDDISSVVQEIVNRSDWNSGNSLSIIMKGTGGVFARKFVGSVDGQVANAPKLIVTYQVSNKKGDLNNDSRVNIIDFSILLSNWGLTGSNPADLNGDGKVGILDFSVLLSNWG